MAYQILSLGAGIQSSALLLMSARGVLPKLDGAVFADTGWEPATVYETLKWLKVEAEKAGIPVHMASKGNIQTDILEGTHLSPPFFVANMDGSQGRLTRQCTDSYKITPINQFLRRDIMGLRHRDHGPSDVRIDLWMGISADEASRMKPSRDAWKRHIYPFCNFPSDMLPRPWKRADCAEWLAKEFPSLPVAKSACIGCLFHSNEDWRRIRSVPEEWAQAVAMDEAIREQGSRGRRLFMHRSMVPLSEAPLGQGADSDGFGEECEGVCSL